MEHLDKTDNFFDLADNPYWFPSCANKEDIEECWQTIAYAERMFKALGKTSDEALIMLKSAGNMYEKYVDDVKDSEEKLLSKEEFQQMMDAIVRMALAEFPYFSQS